jgi:uncharacterized membrane protein YbhN (UPF0104 family)
VSSARPARGRARRIVVGAGGALGAAAVLVAVLVHRREEFVAALRTAPVAILVVAATLQLVALVARSEAWRVSVDAAGGTVRRRPLFRAASLGYLGSQLNSQLGAAARIAALRRAAPDAAPRVPALVAAEIPILVVEGALAAVASVTLVGPLGLPWWTPVACLAAAAAVGAALRGVSRGRRIGFWSGLAVLRSVGGRARMVALVLVAVLAQIARNWMMLRAVHVPASVLDATAALIAMVILSQLPVGPSVGAAATVLILGPRGPGAAAAAGVLLTATGTAGALAYVAWAGCDRLGGVARRAAAKTSHSNDTEGHHMGSNKKKRTTMAKLNRENAVRERRLEKQARRDARKQAPRPAPPAPGTADGA